MSTDQFNIDVICLMLEMIYIQGPREGMEDSAENYLLS